jgi:hypothetical protein
MRIQKTPVVAKLNTASTIDADAMDVYSTIVNSAPTPSTGTIEGTESSHLAAPDSHEPLSAGPDERGATRCHEVRCRHVMPDSRHHQNTGDDSRSEREIQDGVRSAGSDTFGQTGKLEMIALVLYDQNRAWRTCAERKGLMKAAVKKCTRRYIEVVLGA